MIEYKDKDDNKIIKAFDHSMFEIEFRRGNPLQDNFTINILARNVLTLIRMIDAFKPHGEGSCNIVRLENKGVCSDVYVGDVYDYSNSDFSLKKVEE